MDSDAAYSDFVNEQIKAYKTEAQKYLLKIKSGSTEIIDYASLFRAYLGLLNFLEEQGKIDALKKQIDIIVNKLVPLIKKEIQTGNDSSKAQAYIYLAEIYEYKKDVQKAYECCNRAVSLDKKFLAERAGFRNFVLNDKQGALEDYNAALAVETDPQRLAMISYCINQINSGQNFGGLGCGLKLILFLVVILVISAIVYIVFLR